MFVENAMAIVVWAPVAVNTYRLGVLLTRAAYYARAAMKLFSWGARPAAETPA